MNALARIVLLATGLVALGAAPALGADHTGSVSPGGAPFSWDGGPISGGLSDSDAYLAVPCDSPGNDCDDTLVNVSLSHGATAQATASITGPSGTDLDLYVYKSDASGTVGDAVDSSAGGTANEAVTFDVDPGYYLVRVYAATATAASYKGTMKVVARPVPGEVNYGVDPADPNAGQGGGGGGGQATTLANDLAPASIARAPAASQSRVLRGTASDRDGKVAYVDVGLVRRGKGGCSALTASGSWRTIHKCTAPPLLRAKGATRWHLTLRRPLAKGLYVLYSRATDNLGRREAGFSQRNRVRFRVT